MAKQKYRYSKNGASSAAAGGFLGRAAAAVSGFCRELWAVLKDLAAKLAGGKRGGKSEYESRREGERRRQQRREKLILAAILVLPLALAIVMVAACYGGDWLGSCSGCGSCNSCERGEKQEEYSEQDIEIRKFFDEAEEVYAWYTGCYDVKYDEAQAVAGQYDGEYYYRVTERGIENMDELREITSRYFTEEITNALLDTRVYDDVSLFREIDDKLYIYNNYNGAARWDIGERRGHLSSESETEKVFSVDISYEYYSYTFDVRYDYVLTLCEDGEWRFSKFELPAVLLAAKMYGGTE